MKTLFDQFRYASRPDNLPLDQPGLPNTDIYIPSQIDDITHLAEYPIHDGLRQSKTNVGRAAVVGSLNKFSVESDGRIYTVHRASIENTASDRDPSPLADIVSTHGWFTDMHVGETATGQAELDLYGKRLVRQAKLGHRATAISHVRNKLAADTTFSDLGNDVNAIARAMRTLDTVQPDDTSYDQHPLVFSGYSQGGMKAIVAAAQASKHGHRADGLILNRPAMHSPRRFGTAVRETVTMPLKELPTIAALGLESPSNLIDGAKVFRMSKNELANHIRVLPLLLRGTWWALQNIPRDADIMLTEARCDVFNQNWEYTRAVQAHFTETKPTIYHEKGRFAGHLGCGSKTDEKREFTWLKNHDRRSALSGTSPTPSGTTPHAA